MRVGWIVIGMIFLAALGNQAEGGTIVSSSHATLYGYYNTAGTTYNTVGLGPTTSFGPAITSTTVAFSANNRIPFATISGQTGPIDLVFSVTNSAGPTTYTIIFSTRNVTANPAVTFDDFEFEVGSGDVYDSNFALATAGGPSIVSGTWSQVTSLPTQTANSVVWTNIGSFGDVGMTDSPSVKISIPNGISTFTLRAEFFIAPEPATAALIGVGLTILLGHRRSRFVI